MKRTHSSSEKEPTDFPQFWRKLFEDNIIKFLQRIQKKQKVPKITFLVYLYTDSMGHQYGFKSKEYQKAIELLDYFIKCIIEGLTDKKDRYIPGLKEMGFLDSIIWNLCTDHAARRVYRDKFIMINAIAKLELGLKLLDGEHNDLKKLLKIIRKDYSKINGFCTVGGEVYHCWFGGSNPKSPADFQKFYGEAYFREVSSMSEKEQKPVDLIDYMTKQDYVQFLIIPEEENLKNPFQINPKERITNSNPRDYEIKIFSQSGVGIIERAQRKEEIAYKYEIIKAADPLNYGDIGITYGKFYTPEEWLKMTIDHNLPDVPHRFFGFFDCIYAPNCIITSSYEYHFLSLEKLANKKEKMLKDYQTHDGLFREESIVPLTIAGPGIRKSYEIPMGRNIDILPTLLKALDLEFEENKIDGTVLKNILI